MRKGALGLTEQKRDKQHNCEEKIKDGEDQPYVRKGKEKKNMRRRWLKKTRRKSLVRVEKQREEARAPRQKRNLKRGRREKRLFQESEKKAEASLRLLRGRNIYRKSAARVNGGGRKTQEIWQHRGRRILSASEKGKTGVITV